MPLRIIRRASNAQTAAIFSFPPQGGFFSPFEKAPLLGELTLVDGTRWSGVSCGAPLSAEGEVVFTTGMVGYVESLTDPSFRGQILVFAYPLIGNYGVPLNTRWESKKIQVRGVIVSECVEHWSHWEGVHSFSRWLHKQGVPCLSGIDTRALTKKIRAHGVMLGTIAHRHVNGNYRDPNEENLVAQVTVPRVSHVGRGAKHVILVDCGAKESIMRSLVARGVRVTRVPYDYDYTRLRAHGVVISNGPGDPMQCRATIALLQKAFQQKRPLFGICLGSQLMGLAAGAHTYKLPYGHRGQNQPCRIEGTWRCVLTSQNHGYAVRESSLPKQWRVSFRNANDKTVEGIAHRKLPFMSVQFHPEAHPGPNDTDYLFDQFIALLK